MWKVTDTTDGMRAMTSVDFTKPAMIGTLEVSTFALPDVRHVARRSFAWIVDSALLAVIGALFLRRYYRPLGVAVYNHNHALVALHLFGGQQLLAAAGFDFLVSTAVMVAYFTGLEWAFGCTIGKLVFDLRVVDFAGPDITFSQALIRNLLRLVDGFPFGWPLIGWFVAVKGGRRQRLGDRGAGTLVVARSSADRVRRDLRARAILSAPSILATRTRRPSQARA
jgi:uncharacterized RDD family membrane protein YckC